MDFLLLLLFVLPAYIANAVPVLFGGGETIDFGQKFFDGQRVFGSSKTIRGFISGILGALVTGLVLALIVPTFFLPSLDLQGKLVVSFLLGLGAMAGDLFGSFIKRRLGFKPGDSIFLLDQLLFILAALLFASAYYQQLFKEINSDSILFLLIVTYLVHLGANIFAHSMKLKKVPW